MRYILPTSLMTLFGSTTNALAAGADGGGGGLLIALFFAFFALIIVCQLLPGLFLFAGMLKGLFTRAPETRGWLRRGGRSA